MRIFRASGGVSSGSNTQVNSLGVGTAPNGTAGRIDLLQMLRFASAGASIVFGGNNNSIGAGGSGGINIQNGSGGVQLTGNAQFAQSALVHGATPAVDASQGLYFTLAVTSNIADVIQPPTNPPGQGPQRITFEIRNTSGGALTTQPAFSAAAGGFRVSGLPSIANGQFYTVSFWYNRNTSLWMQDGSASPAQSF